MFLQNLGFSINCLSVIRPASKSLSKCCYISVNISFLFCIAVMLNKKKKKYLRHGMLGVLVLYKY